MKSCCLEKGCLSLQQSRITKIHWGWGEPPDQCVSVRIVRLSWEVPGRLSWGSLSLSKATTLSHSLIQASASVVTLWSYSTGIKTSTFKWKKIKRAQVWLCSRQETHPVLLQLLHSNSPQHSHHQARKVYPAIPRHEKVFSHLQKLSALL